MDAQLLVGPVESWAEADPVRILHLLESVFYMELRPAAMNNLFCRPTVIVGAKDPLAQPCMLEHCVGLHVRPKGEIQSSLGLSNFGSENLGNILALGYLGQSFIVIGLLCNEEGVPLSVEVFTGNT